MSGCCSRVIRRGWWWLGSSGVAGSRVVVRLPLASLAYRPNQLPDDELVDSKLADGEFSDSSPANRETPNGKSADRECAYRRGAYGQTDGCRSHQRHGVLRGSKDFHKGILAGMLTPQLACHVQRPVRGKPKWLTRR